jgi:hypothetical protein
MKKIYLEYIFHTSKKLLFNRISTASGLAEWFANDVSINENKLTFEWNDSSQDAIISKDKNNLYVKFKWLDNPERFTELKIEQDKITKDLILLITEVIEDDDDEDFSINVWNSSIKKLKRKLGLPVN